MTTALLDTSTNTAVFALIEDQKQVFYREKTGRFGASIILPEMLRDAQKEGFSVNNFHSWIVGKGPGSFTGTRVGIAFAQGIATGAKSIMRGSNSGFLFLPTLLEHNAHATSIAILHDGRRDEAIVNIFLLENNSWIPSEIFICKLTEIATRCASIDSLGTIMTRETYGESAQQLDAKTLYEIKPDPLGLLLDKTAMPSTSSEEELSLTPIYVRPAVFVKPLVTRDL